MNKSNLLAPLTWAFLALLLLAPGVRAQPTYAPAAVQSRYLIVMETSAAMKKRIPAVSKGLNQLFDINLLGQFRPGDSVGVWTFDQSLRTGELPLEYWQSGMTVTICSNVILFLQNYHYAHNGTFAEVMPKVNRLVAGSSQLTVVIFCDGNSPISGTPVDASINNVFKQAASMMKTIRQPFVIVLRSQFGKYTGFTINTANAVNLPAFPPPPPEPVEVVTPPPQPQPIAQKPLVIIGNTVGTNPLPPSPPPQMIEKMQPPPVQPAPSPAPAPAAPMPNPTPPQTFSTPPIMPAPVPQPAPKPMPAPAVVESTPTNVIAAPAQAVPPPMAQAPAAPVIVESSPISRAGLFAIVCGVLFVIALAAYIFVRLTHKRQPSLITESLKKS